MGRQSGAPVDQAIAIVWTLRDGLIWRGQAFLDQREALEAVGLRD
jgi:ketosteroid isomerase-like protein